jgi:sugar phosphate isomerase/epimerase
MKIKLPYEQWKELDRAMAFLDETVNEVPIGIRIEPEAPSLVQLSAEMWELIDELKPEEETK